MPATIRIPKRSKYNVRTDAQGKAARTYNGVTYHSVAEAKFAAQLDLRKRVGEIISWERQSRYALVVKGVIVGNIVIDFEVRFEDRWEYIEIKGVDTAVGKLKRKIFEALTGRKITVINAKDVR